ncbi:MAG: nitroreductase family protein [Candidatus Thermoplasmatota archaeon]|nr:nitroreductase family protein [Candidatus Thermoplasmatota archaeon]
MELDQVIEKRRSRRAYDPVEITDDMVKKLLQAAGLAPSCSNNQPWRFVLVRDPQQLDRLFGTLSGGNYWMKKASMVVAVFTEKGTDCDVQGVQYEMFDTGMATALLLLKATEMGLLTHPVAGFNKEKAKDVLGLGELFILITLIGVGKGSEDTSGLSEKHREQEVSARVRRPHEEISFMDRYPSG